MPKRSFDDGFWGDSFVQELSKDAKLLFAFLWTNKRCNSAGIYEITLKTISFETGLDIGVLPQLLKVLEPKVKWVDSENIIWVKNFLKHQPHSSPLYMKAVYKCLEHISSNGLVKEFIEYYDSIGVSIPYTEGIDTLSIPHRYLPDLDKDIDKDIDNKGRGDLVKQVFAGIDKLRGYRPPKRKPEAAAIIRMLKQYTPDQIIETWRTMKQDKFWVDKELYLMSVESQIGAVQSGTHKQGNRGSDEQANDSSKYTTGKYGNFVRK